MIHRIKYYICFLPFIIFFISLSSCDLFTETEDDKKDIEPVDVSGFTIENYPKVDGSTSTKPLQTIIACNILNVEYEIREGFDGTMWAYPNDNDPEKREEVELIHNISHNGTHGSYVNLIEKNADIIIVARNPSEDEQILAEDLDVQILTTAVALDAFVFILNTENPVNNLTISQIQAIYSGNILNWNEVGGLNAVINPYRRNENSGSHELMKNLVMKNLPMIEAPDMLLGTMIAVINNLNQDKNGIGYTVYFYNTSMASRDNIKMCEIDGVFPKATTISDGSYPLTTKVYIAIRADLPEESNAFLLWKWMQTVAGQQIVAESGYIPHLN